MSIASLTTRQISYLFVRLVWGQKVLEASAHSISSPRPTLRRKKCPRMNEDIYIYIYISVCEKLLSLAIYFSERGLLGKFYINKNKF